MAFTLEDLLAKAKGIVPDNVNIFGAGIPANTKILQDAGLLDPEAVKKAEQQSLFQGLLGAGLGYLAQPKNQGYGSAVPYLAKAYGQGIVASQKPYEQLSQDAITKEKVDEILATRESKKIDKDMLDNLLLDPRIANDPLLKIAAKKDPVKVMEIINKKPESPFGKINLPNVTDESRAAWEQTVTPENPNGNVFLLKEKSNESPTNLTKYINQRDNLNQSDPLYKSKYNVYTQAIQKEIEKNNALVEINPGETSFNKKAGESLFDKIDKEVQAGDKGTQAIDKTGRALNLLVKGEPVLGQFSAITLAYKKTMNERFGGTPTKRDLDSISDTELLQSTLGSDVFPLIGELNIGARGLDTPEERKFLQSAFTGDTSMNKDTLIKMTAIRQKYALKAVQDYNNNLLQGKYNKYISQMGELSPKNIYFNPPAILNDNLEINYKIREGVLNDNGKKVNINYYGNEENPKIVDTEGNIWEVNSSGDYTKKGAI